MLYDRLTGRPLDGAMTLPGQTILTAPGWIDGFPVERGAVVVTPRPSKRTKVHLGASEQHISVVEIADSMDAIAIDDLAATVQSSSRSWFGLAIEVPVVAVGLDEKARLLDADREIENHLPHLAAVAHKPKTRLRESRELTPIGRVRRPARGAEARLAAHSEDWNRRRFRSVEPLRLLSRRLLLDLDLYENRIAAALLDPEVPRYLGQRLQELDRLDSAYSEALQALDEGTFWRRRRIYDLWRGEFEDESAVSDARHRTRETIRHLTELLQRVRQLHSSPLTVELRGKYPDGRSLRLTNILVNDQHYRRVGQLWKAIVEDRSDKEAPVDRLQRLQRRHHAMAGYVAGMAARVLTAMSYEPSDESRTGPGEGDIHLDGPWGSAVFSWKADDTLLVGHPSRLTRIVPIATDLPAIIQARGLDALAPIRAACRDSVIAYLGSGNEPELTAQTLMNPPVVDTGRAGAPEGSLIAVTPIEPTSIERLGRVVFRAVLEPVLRAYPPELRIAGDPVPPRLRDVISGLGFVHIEDDCVTLTRPLEHGDRARLEEELTSVAEAGRGPGWQREHQRFLGPLKKSTLEASRDLERMLACPVCGARNHVRAWSQRSQGTFEVRCSSCESAWGLDACGNCGDRFPVLFQPHLDKDLHVTGDGWVERIVGRDSLSTPCWARIPGRRTFICPTCRHCGATGSQAASACVRCMGGV